MTDVACVCVCASEVCVRVRCVSKSNPKCLVSFILVICSGSGLSVHMFGLRVMHVFACNMFGFWVMGHAFRLLVMHSVTNSVYRCVRNVDHVSGLCVACWVVRLGCASLTVTNILHADKLQW